MLSEQEKVFYTMTNTKVSVILPSYNVAAYIRETLLSAAGQTLAGLEIICVDAGSSDGTREIIRDFAASSDACRHGIVIIDSDEKSYGHQINLGIGAAHGEYIAILETDDIAAPGMYESLYALGERTGADVVKSTYFDYFGEAGGQTDIGPFRACDGDGTGRDRYTIPGRASVSRLAAITAPAETFVIEECPELLLHHPSVWSALYRKDYLERCHIRMPEIPGAGWADNPFMLESLLAAERITYTPKAWYYYRKDNPSSSTAMKDCSMPFLRIADMRAVLERYAAGEGPRRISQKAAETIARTIDHRALRYAADALSSPAYDEKRDGALIRQTLASVPDGYLSDAHVTGAERMAFNHFTGKNISESPAHMLASIAYKVRYGLAYLKNTSGKG